MEGGECSSPLYIIRKKLRVYRRYVSLIDDLLDEAMMVHEVKGAAHVHRYHDRPFWRPLLVEAIGYVLGDTLEGCRR